MHNANPRNLIGNNVYIIIYLYYIDFYIHLYIIRISLYK